MRGWIGAAAAGMLAGVLLVVLLGNGGPDEGTAPTPATVDWAPTIEVAVDEAWRGPWRMNDSEFHYVDDPTVALDPQGNAVVVWGDQRRQDLFLQVWDPQGRPRFESPVPVSRSPGTFSWLPRVVADDEAIHVLWQEIVFSGGSHGGEIFHARSTDGGRSFEPPVNLSNTTAGAGKGRLTPERWHNGSLDLVRDDQGVLHVAWTEYEGRLWTRRSTDEGRSFSEPLLVAGPEPPTRGPALAAAGGEVYLAWTVGDDPAADIHLARSRDGGASFEPARPVHPGPGRADAPSLLLGEDGTLHLAWAESPRGPRGPTAIRHARDAGEGFEPPRTVAPPDDDDAAGFPHLATDGAGRLYLLWERYPRWPGDPLGLGMAFSEDGGATFTGHGVVPGTADPKLGFNGSQQGLLMRKLAVRGEAVAVVNSSYREGVASRIRLVRGRAPAEPEVR